ncbi:MAG: hypothetical protein ACK5VX_18520, partial [Akkermansiaceae bacterium]
WQYLKGHGMAGYLTRSGAELGEKLFEEVRLLLNDTDTIRSVSTVKLAKTHGLLANSLINNLTELLEI